MTDKTDGRERVAALQGLRQVVESAVEPAPEVLVSKEYELRYPNGKHDTFTDIGDASDFRDQFFPDGVLFERTVTTTIVRTEWTEVR